MPLLDVNRSVLLVVDLQGKLMEMVYRNNSLKTVSIRLLKLADLFNVPVLLTEQYPRGLGRTHPEVLEVFESLKAPTKTLDKTAFGCGGDPQFLPMLNSMRPGLEPKDLQVVVCGIEAHICVTQTVLALRHWGYPVHLCWDAVSARGEEYYRNALRRMEQAGAVLTNHESVGFEWARDKNHACFKPMSNLFKDALPL
jgi:nicotinamidase-related amidase